MKVGIIIQARYGSTRLPRKVLKKIQGKTVLEHDILRVKQAKKVDEIIIATSTQKNDDKICKEAEIIGVPYFRGSENDVLSRYYFAAKENKFDVVVRITSDCPLIDPFIIDKVIDDFFASNSTISSNATTDISQRTFPRGLDTEVFSFISLENAFYKAKESYQREHVTPYIYENAKKISIVKNDIDYSSYRLTLDTIEDFELVTIIYEYLYHGQHDFYLEEIVELLKSHPEIVCINNKIEQKKLKE